MQVDQYEMRLTQNEMGELERKSSIRSIQVPDLDFHFYPKQNFLVKYDYFGIQIYSVNQFDIQFYKTLHYKFGAADYVFFLENHIVQYYENHFIKTDIENSDQCQIFYGHLPPDIIKYEQINGNSFMVMIRKDERIRIYSLKNFKKSHTLLNKRQIYSILYHQRIVQVYYGTGLYYYNTTMRKLIRKYCNHFYMYIPIFNSNYLFVPKISYDNTKKSLLTIFDIQSMKIKGTIEITDNSVFKYDSCIFIKEFNVVGVLYKTRLDLYDFTTGKCINSEFNSINQWQQQILDMIYDKNNGLTIIIK